MTMVGSSNCQVLVPGCHHHEEDAGDEDDSDIDDYKDYLEDYAPVIIGVSSRGEGKTKSGLSEAFGE